MNEGGSEQEPSITFSAGFLPSSMGWIQGNSTIIVLFYSRMQTHLGQSQRSLSRTVLLLYFLFHSSVQLTSTLKQQTQRLPPPPHKTGGGVTGQIIHFLLYATMLARTARLTTRLVHASPHRCVVAPSTIVLQLPWLEQHRSWSNKAKKPKPLSKKAKKRREKEKNEHKFLK